MDFFARVFGDVKFAESLIRACKSDGDLPGFARTFGYTIKRSDVVACLERMTYGSLRKPQAFKEDIVAALREQSGTERSNVTGLVEAAAFTSPGLSQTYRDDRLYFYVPSGYDAGRPHGLIIYMHGGGNGTPREMAFHVVSSPRTDQNTYHIQPFVEKNNFILVAPSAPWNPGSHYRWCLPEADQYILDVIRECHYRFNIDPDRVVLGGQSMGGFGAYHLAQRLADRLAAGIVSAGSWYTCDFRAWRGLPLCIIHGRIDSPGHPHLKHRPRFTDVFFARSAHKLLDQVGVENIYLEHRGAHVLREAPMAVKKAVKWAAARRRDPFHSHVVALSPRGWRLDLEGADMAPTPHNRWLSINATRKSGFVEVDHVLHTGPKPKWAETKAEWSAQGFRLAKFRIRGGGMADAIYGGDNYFKIKTENVNNLSLWLHPAMVDFTKPLKVEINGKKHVCKIKPSLLDAVRSFLKSQDWGLIYYCKKQFEVDVK